MKAKPAPDFDWSQLERVVVKASPPKGAVTVDDFAQHFKLGYQTAWTRLHRLVKSKELETGLFLKDRRHKVTFGPQETNMAQYQVDVDVTYRTSFTVEARSQDSAFKKALKMADTETHSAPTVIVSTEVVGIEPV